MAKSNISDTVSEADNGLFTFTCPAESGCGSKGMSFTSSDWPTSKIAEARGIQHLAEHVNQVPMQDLEEFKVEHGVAQAAPITQDLSDYLPKGK